MIIVDTSTIIKGFFARYPEPRFIVDRIADGTFQLAMTEEMAKELSIAVFTVARNKRRDPKPFLRNVASFIYNAETIPSITSFTSCSDPDDSMFIECAIDGRVKNVISSDPAIFNIKSYIQNQTESQLITNIDFYNPETFYNAFNARQITI